MKWPKELRAVRSGATVVQTGVKKPLKSRHSGAGRCAGKEAPLHFDPHSGGRNQGRKIVFSHSTVSWKLFLWLLTHALIQWLVCVPLGENGA